MFGFDGFSGGPQQNPLARRSYASLLNVYPSSSMAYINISAVNLCAHNSFNHVFDFMQHDLVILFSFFIS
jgi:hypothetical protein